MRYTPRSLIKRVFGPIDKVLFFTCAAASLFGMVLIISAVTVPPDDIDPGRTILVQAVAVAAGMVGMLIVSFFDYNILKRFTKYLMPAGIVLLLGTALFAPNIGGNRSWIPLGFISIQTSEFVKLIFIITFAAHIDAVSDNINTPKNLLLLIAHGGIYIFAVILQDDYGMAAIYILIFMTMLFFSGIRLKIILMAAVPVIASIPFIWTFVLQERHRLRIIVAFNPELDPLGMGYQANQSITAISNGGYLGMGFRQGYITQQPNRLFAKHTDFIFAVCGEEFGFLGCMAVMLIFAVIILKIFNVRKKIEDNFGRMILIGLSSMFLFQVVINIGMCVGLMPVVGITLPFMSSGGSSMLSVWLAVGIVMSILRNGRRQKLFDVI